MTGTNMRMARYGAADASPASDLRNAASKVLRNAAVRRMASRSS